MGKQKVIQPPEEDGAMDMSPMIDMVFLLLIFFVVNATAITVKRDAKVEMPIASNSAEVKSANGCIVVNVYGGERPNGAPADLTWGTDDSRPLRDDQELREYIHNKKELFTKQGHECKIYLRGDKKSLFKGSRGVIRAASSEGIIDMVFGVIPTKGS